MITEKLTSLKEELETIVEKEKALYDALRQTQELKLRYLGAVEVLEKLDEKPEEKKKK